MLADWLALVDADSEADVLADADALVEADSDADVLADWLALVDADSEALVLADSDALVDADSEADVLANGLKDLWIFLLNIGPQLPFFGQMLRCSSSVKQSTGNNRRNLNMIQQVFFHFGMTHLGQIKLVY